MTIRRLQVFRYRSIKHLDIALGDVTAFVGANNAGKTNILSALNLLLGSRYPTAAALDSKDHFGRKAGPMKVRVEFGANQHRTRSMHFMCNAGKLGENGLWAEDMNDKRTRVSADHRDAFALVYLDADRSFDRVFGVSEYTLFGRAIRHLNEDFRSSVPVDVQERAQASLRDAQEILRTPLYNSFVAAVSEGFSQQLKNTGHAVGLDFRTFNPLNLYRTLQPMLNEGGMDRNPAEAGSGLRNLIVLALFRAYAKTFRGDAVIAVEEPEIYLHPHAQRSLAALFRELAAQGNQVLYSTHSTPFVSPEHFDQIAIVERTADDQRELCTRVRSLRASDLVSTVAARVTPGTVTEASLKERLRHACGQEHAEAFFARAVVIVEGPTERAALPVYAEHMGIPLDGHGISIVSAGGKNSIPLLFDLYRGLGFPVFVVFDNDRGNGGSDVETNKLLTKMLGLASEEQPAARVGRDHCIMAGDYEKTVRADLEAIHPGFYQRLETDGKRVLGDKVGKPLMARFMARQLVASGMVPASLERLIKAIEQLAVQAAGPLGEEECEEDKIPF